MKVIKRIGTISWIIIVLLIAILIADIFYSAFSGIPASFANFFYYFFFIASIVLIAVLLLSLMRDRYRVTNQTQNKSL
jgi:membrane protein implicated in regulation of membrane protease activity